MENKKERDRTLIFSLSILGVVLLLFLGLDVLLNRGMLSFKQALLNYFSEATGCKFEYSTISPSIFSFLEIRNLKLKNALASNQIVGDFKRISFHYSLPTLLFSSDKIKALQRIDIATGHLQVDAEREKKLFDFLDEILDSSSGEFRLAKGFYFKAQNLNLDYTTKTENFKFENIIIDFKEKDNYLDFSLQADLNLKSIKQNQPSLQAKFSGHGRLNTNFSTADAIINLQDLKFSGLRVYEQQFRLLFQENLLTLAKAQARLPLDFRLEYYLPLKKISAYIMAENLEPANLIDLEEPLLFLQPLLKINLNTYGEVSYYSETNKLDYQFEIEGKLPHDFLKLNLNFKTSISGNEKLIALKPFLINSNLGSLLFSGDIIYQSLLPDGQLILSKINTGLTGEVNANFAIQRSVDKVSINSSSLLIGNTSFKDFILTISPQKDYFYFDLHSSTNEHWPVNKLDLQGSFYLDKPLLIMTTSFANLPINSILKAFTFNNATLENIFSPLLITGKLELETDFKTFSLNMPDTALTSKLSPTNYLVFNLEATENNIKLSDWHGNWDNYSSTGQLKVELAHKNNFTFSSTFTLADQHYELYGEYQEDLGLLVSGLYNLSFVLIPDGRNGYYFALTADELPLFFNIENLSATIDWLGYFSKEEGLELVARQTTLKGLPLLLAGMKDASLEIKFLLKNNLINLTEVVYADETSKLKGNGLLNYKFDNELNIDGWLYLADNKQAEKYTAFFSFLPSKIDFALTFNQSPLSRLGFKPLGGGLGGTLRLTGFFPDPELEADLFLENGKFNFEDLKANFKLNLNRDLLQLTDFNLSLGSNYQLKDGELNFFRENGDFKARLNLLDKRQVEALDLVLSFAGSFPKYNPKQSLFDQDLKCVLTVKEGNQLKNNSANWDINLVRNSEAIYISGGPANSIQGLLETNGKFNINFTKPFFIQGNLSGQLQEDQLTASLQNLNLDLTVLNYFINSNYFIIKKGNLLGNLLIKGPVTDPDFSGELFLTNFSFKSSIIADNIEPLESPLVVNPKVIELPYTFISAAGKRIGISASLFFGHWNLAAFKTSLSFPEQPGLKVTLPSIEGFFIDGCVSSPHFSLLWQPDGLSLQGSFLVHSCNLVWTGEINSESVKTQADNFNYDINLLLTTGKQVDFYWPSKEFPILKMASKPGSQLSIKYNKLNNLLSLIGEIHINSGSVYYFERSFVIKEGSLTFIENQDSFNPILNLKAERQFRYRDQVVKLILSAINQHLQNFEPIIESDPPLPITERYLALGGIIQDPESENQEGYLTAALTDLGGDLLTQFLLLRPLEEKVRELLNLDSVSIRTHFIKNLLLDTIFYSEQELNKDNYINLGRYLDNTEISFQKYLDEQNDLFFEMIVRLKTSANAFYPATEQSFGNLDVQSEFSLELTTPFFLTIKWSITPQHWESFFLPDSKITFKWGTIF